MGQRQRVLAGVLAVLVLTACAEDELRENGDAEGAVVLAGDMDVFDLQPGDCLAVGPTDSFEVAELPVVPCAEPHQQEVYATVEHPAGPYPGAEAVAAYADGACIEELGKPPLNLSLDDGVFFSYLLPTFDGWNATPDAASDNLPDRTIVCVLVFPNDDAPIGSVVAGDAQIDPAQPAPPRPDGLVPEGDDDADDDDLDDGSDAGEGEDV